MPGNDDSSLVHVLGFGFRHSPSYDDDMPYAVKEIVYTLQGEGAQCGRAAVFCRFAGCNLWSGHEADRATAVCRFCDTEFVGTDGPGGGRFETAAELVDAIARAWQPGAENRGSKIEDRGSEFGSDRDPLSSILDPLSSGSHPFVVFTGGEPALQLDAPVVDALHARGFDIAIETNGTLDLAGEIDWVCVSPKADAALRVVSGDELKLIHPQAGAEPERYEHLAFRHFFLQPMDGPAREGNTREVVAYCLRHPRWRISLQTHKILGIP
jgi:7-carboxy-7-deazaguanine synthase (Cx14CxxC type)